MNDNDDNIDDAERAIAERLAKLGRMPVDASGLKSRLEAKIDEAANKIREAADAAIPRARRWRVPLACAALVLIGVGATAFLWLQTSDRPHILTPDELAIIHEHYHEGGKSLTAVTSVSEANAVMSKKWAAAPRFPEMEGTVVEACCLYELRDFRVACLHLKSQNQNVTVVVGNIRDLRLSDMEDVQLQGQKLAVGGAGLVNIVSPPDPERIIALVSNLPQADLVKLTASLHY